MDCEWSGESQTSVSIRISILEQFMIKKMIVIFYISMKVMDVVMEKGEALYRTTIIISTIMSGILKTQKIPRLSNLIQTKFGNLILAKFGNLVVIVMMITK